MKAFYSWLGNTIKVYDVPLSGDFQCIITLANGLEFERWFSQWQGGYDGSLNRAIFRCCEDHALAQSLEHVTIIQ